MNLFRSSMPSPWSTRKVRLVDVGAVGRLAYHVAAATRPARMKMCWRLVEHAALRVHDIA
jgi:hypothetical protein